MRFFSAKHPEATNKAQDGGKNLSAHSNTEGRGHTWLQGQGCKFSGCLYPVTFPFSTHTCCLKLRVDHFLRRRTEQGINKTALPRRFTFCSSMNFLSGCLLGKVQISLQKCKLVWLALPMKRPLLMPSGPRGDLLLCLPGCSFV